MAIEEGFVGDGVSSAITIPLSFDTEVVAIRLFDTTKSNAEILAFRMRRQFPTATSITLTLTPVPATNSIKYVVTDGSEFPEGP